MDTKVKTENKKTFYLRVYAGNYVGSSNRHSYQMACAYFIKLLNYKLRKIITKANIIFRLVFLLKMNIIN